MENNLLIIDDNKEIIEIVSLILIDLFDSIKGVCSVEDAREMLIKNSYSLIFLDIDLNSRNGGEVVKFLSETENNFNKNTPVIVLSGIINPKFIEKNQSRFAGIITKPFDHLELINSVEKILTNNQLDDEIPIVKCELPFPLPQLEQQVHKVLDQVRKSPKLKQLFNKMKVDRNVDNYISTHIGMIINISTAICMQMEWNTDKTLEKFVYAAYLHDMALSDRPDLARVNTFLELEAKKDFLSVNDYKLIFDHSNIAANTISEMNEIPPDVEIMIRHHHELPKGNGFPAKAVSQKIAPLSAVFIVAHDLTDYILNNSNWSLGNYISLSKEKFQGAHFMKVLKVLNDIK